MNNQPVLKVSGATKRFEGFSLSDVSFSLPPGHIMGLVGHNGAGKTTLLSLILGLIHLDAGSIELFGKDSRIRGSELRAHVGFVHEVPNFYRSLSVARTGQILGAFYPTWDEVLFAELSTQFGLSPGKRVGHLSHGMRTRLGLAIALSHHARLLLLDEPSSGLDPGFRRELLERLSSMVRGGGVSVLFSTHITSDLDRIADFVTFIKKGRLVFSESRETVMDRWKLIQGGPDLARPDLAPLLAGWVEGEFGVTGLTERAPAIESALGADAVAVRPATLEDVVFFTGRSGKGGLKLHDRKN